MVIDEKASWTVRVGAQLEESTRTQLKVFLKQNADVMTYNANEMLGMDPYIIVHHQNVKAEGQPVK